MDVCFILLDDCFILIYRYVAIFAAEKINLTFK